MGTLLFLGDDPMKTYYGITRISQLFEMIEDVCEAMKSENENIEATKELMICTAAQETKLGTLMDKSDYRYGTGIMQIDPIGITDILRRGNKWIEFCKRKYDIHFDKLQHRELETSALLCVIASRIRYKVVPQPIPNTTEGLWEYYKRYYNSYLGAATKEEYMKNREWALGLYKKWKEGENI
jgi:hypothetical protein